MDRATLPRAHLKVQSCQIGVIDSISTSAGTGTKYRYRTRAILTYRDL